MESQPYHQKLNDRYHDDQVLIAVRSSNGGNNQLVVTWFFQTAQNYAKSYLKSHFPDLGELEWDVIFANVNLKFVSRIKRGLELKPDTKLTTYYTSISKFAALDFVRDRQSQQNYQEVEDYQAIEHPVVEQKMEKEERAREIKAWLNQIVGHEDQVKVLLLQARGFSYRDILAQTEYQSEGACRNALLKSKKKIADYLMQHPETARKLKKLLRGE